MESLIKRMWGLAAVAAAVVAANAQAQKLTTVSVASGLSNPVFVTSPPGDTNRIFILEKNSGNTGRIRIVKNGSLLATPFLSISPVANGSEQGLLGMAFHPDYANNGKFYVNYTRGADIATVVAEYTVSADPDIANPASAKIVMIVAQPFPNHNGGWIGFGPKDGYLYIAFGDGGNGNDPQGNGQNINVLLGKMLRVDINGDDFPADPNRNYANPPTNPFVGVAGADEIWAYGLRNPWRNDFDDLTGDFFIADVGQGQIEELNFQAAASTGGENYGWRCMEGTRCTGLSGCTCNSSGLELPIHEYSHTGGNCSITGGAIYRGSTIPTLPGTYFFADYCSAKIWSLEYDGASVKNFTERTAELKPPGGTISSISSFGEDASGEIYICSLGGTVYRVKADEVPCADVKKFKVKCTNGTLKVVTKLSNTTHDGKKIAISVNGTPINVAVSGKKSVYKQGGYSGSVTVSMLSPAGCQADVVVDCS